MHLVMMQLDVSGLVLMVDSLMSQGKCVSVHGGFPFSSEKGKWYWEERKEQGCHWDIK